MMAAPPLASQIVNGADLLSRFTALLRAATKESLRLAIPASCLPLWLECRLLSVDEVLRRVADAHGVVSAPVLVSLAPFLSLDQARQVLANGVARLPPGGWREQTAGLAAVATRLCALGAAAEVPPRLATLTYGNQALVLSAVIEHLPGTVREPLLDHLQEWVADIRKGEDAAVCLLLAARTADRPRRQRFLALIEEHFHPDDIGWHCALLGLLARAGEWEHARSLAQRELLEFPRAQGLAHVYPHLPEAQKPAAAREWLDTVVAALSQHSLIGFKVPAPLPTAYFQEVIDLLARRGQPLETALWRTQLAAGHPKLQSAAFDAVAALSDCHRALGMLSLLPILSAGQQEHAARVAIKQLRADEAAHRVTSYQQEDPYWPRHGELQLSLSFPARPFREYEPLCVRHLPAAERRQQAEALLRKTAELHEEDAVATALCDLADVLPPDKQRVYAQRASELAPAAVAARRKKREASQAGTLPTQQSEPAEEPGAEALDQQIAHTIARLPFDGGQSLVSLAPRLSLEATQHCLDRIKQQSWSQSPADYGIAASAALLSRLAALGEGRAAIAAAARPSPQSTMAILSAIAPHLSGALLAETAAQARAAISALRWPEDRAVALQKAVPLLCRAGEARRVIFAAGHHLQAPGAVAVLLEVAKCEPELCSEALSIAFEFVARSLHEHAQYYLRILRPVLAHVPQPLARDVLVAALSIMQATPQTRAHLLAAYAAELAPWLYAVLGSDGIEQCLVALLTPVNTE